jgi:Uma2 family endonuclease
MISMRALLLDPEEFLEERVRQGHIRDEVWDGVLHVVPQPTSHHQVFGAELIIALGPLVKARGWLIAYEAGVYEHAKNYRVPDVLVFDPSRQSERGVERRCELIIEILSPKDESHAKLPYYAKTGTREVWIIDRVKRIVDVHVLQGDRYDRRSTEQGSVDSPVLGIALQTLAGPRLRVGAVEI